MISRNRKRDCVTRGLDFDFDMLGLGIAHHLKGQARFDAVENGDQSVGEVIAGGHLPHQILLVWLEGTNRKGRKPAFFCQRLRALSLIALVAFDQLAENP